MLTAKTPGDAKFAKRDGMHHKGYEGHKEDRENEPTKAQGHEDTKVRKASRLLPCHLVRDLVSWCLLRFRLSLCPLRPLWFSPVFLANLASLGVLAVSVTPAPRR